MRSVRTLLCRAGDKPARHASRKTPGREPAGLWTARNSFELIRWLGMKTSTPTTNNAHVPPSRQIWPELKLSAVQLRRFRSLLSECNEAALDMDDTELAALARKAVAALCACLFPCARRASGPSSGNGEHGRPPTQERNPTNN